MDAHGQRKKILLVDDAVDYLLGSSILFESRGFDVTTAAGGREALKKLETFTPDIILVDLMMPDMDGVELCRRIRSERNLRGVPILLASAVRQRQPVDSCFDAFLEKAGFYDLLSGVEQWLDHSRAVRAAAGSGGPDGKKMTTEEAGGSGPGNPSTRGLAAAGPQVNGHELQVGDQVVHITSREIGTIEAIDRGVALVSFKQGRGVWIIVSLLKKVSDDEASSMKKGGART